MEKIKPYTAFFIFVLSFIIRSIDIGFQDIAHDEPFSIYHALFPVGDIIEILKNYNNPPLFEIILHYWIKLFGISAIAVRSLSILASSLACVYLFLLGKELYNYSAGLISSLLLCFSSISIYYALDCRVYSIYLLLCISSSYYFIKSLNYSKPSDYINYIIHATLLIYAHYFGIIMLCLHTIFIVILYRHSLIKFIKYYIIIILLYTPHLYSLAIRMGDSVQNGTWVEKPNGLESIYNLFWSFSNFPFITVTLLASIAIGSIVIIKNKIENNRTYILTLIWLFVPVFGLFFLSYKVPVFLSRYLLLCLPAYYLLSVRSIQNLQFSHKITTIIFTAIVLCFACTADYSPNKKNKDQLATGTIRHLKKENVLVIVSPFDYILTLGYHYDELIFRDIKSLKEYKDIKTDLGKENIHFINDYNEVRKLKPGNYSSIVFLDNGIGMYSPVNSIRDSLNTHFKLKCHKMFKDNFNLYYYVIPTRTMID